MKIEKKVEKKGTGYFFCMNCPVVEDILVLPEKVACPLINKEEKRNGDTN